MLTGIASLKRCWKRTNSVIQSTYCTAYLSLVLYFGFSTFDENCIYLTVLYCTGLPEHDWKLTKTHSFVLQSGTEEVRFPKVNNQTK